MGKFKIFIVDDNPGYGKMLAYYLSMNPDFELKLYTTAADIIDNLHLKPDLITLDYSLPDGSGEIVLQKIKMINPEIPVFVISAQENITTAITLLKAGAAEYFVKNEHTRELLWNAIKRVQENHSLKNELVQLKEELGNKYNINKFIKGNSAAIYGIYGIISKASQTTMNVSISGETGTGKEVVAKAIHYNSERANKAMVTVNMAAIPKELLESELFGHEKGAFTGANTRKTGKFEEANKGTLFLDEIAELDLGLQSKLLRVIQERELTRVGGNEKVVLDIRIITATHRNLADEVRKGSFREDLYYRLMGIPIVMPPLRDRGQDILILAAHFLNECCGNNKLAELTIHPLAREKLLHYHYPGNVRELKAIIELAAVMASSNSIRIEDISFYPVLQDNELITGDKTMKEYTIDIISSCLRKNDNNVVKVAEQLDVGKSTIYKLIKDKVIVI